MFFPVSRLDCIRGRSYALIAFTAYFDWGYSVIGNGSGRWAIAAAMLVVVACSNSTLPSGREQAVQAGGDQLTPGVADTPRAEQPLTESVPGAEAPAQTSPSVTAGPTGDAAGPTGGEESAPESRSPAAPSPRPIDGSTGGGSTVGVTKDSITISASGIWSGPYAAFTNKQFDNGFMTWVNEVNAAGGIHGRRVVVKKVDNHATPEGAVAACKEETTNGSFVVIGLSAMSAELDCLDEGGIPTLALGSDRDPESWKVVRAVESRPSVGAAVARFAKARMNAAEKKVGVMVLNLGLNIAMADRFASTAKQIGIDVVGTERVEQNQGSFVAELSRLRGAGAEVVVMFVLTEAIGILRDARAIGYEPTFTGATFAADDLSQVARDLMDGIMALRAYGPSDSPEFKRYRAEASKQGRSNVTTTDSRHYGMGQVVEHVLEAAGPSLTRESFVAAADRTRNFVTGIVQPVTWEPSDPIGSRAHFPVICCNPDNTWKGLGPPAEKF